MLFRMQALQERGLPTISIRTSKKCKENGKLEADKRTQSSGNDSLLESSSLKYRKNIQNDTTWRSKRVFIFDLQTTEKSLHIIKHKHH